MDPQTERRGVSRLARKLFRVSVALVVVAAVLLIWALGAPLPGNPGADRAASALVIAGSGAVLNFGAGAAGRHGWLLAGALAICAGAICHFASATWLLFGSMDLAAACLEEMAR